jgi:hypothetical protein
MASRFGCWVQRMHGGEQTQLGKQIAVSEGEHCGHMVRTRRHESRAGSALHMHVARVRSRHRLGHGWCEATSRRKRRGRKDADEGSRTMRA